MSTEHLNNIQQELVKTREDLMKVRQQLEQIRHYVFGISTLLLAFPEDGNQKAREKLLTDYLHFCSQATQ